MKLLRLKHLLLASFASAGIIASAPAAIITVNTVDNTDFSAGKTNLYLAISLANTNGESSNTINFDIPGAGPHYIVTPQFSAPGSIADLNGGYPIITNHNLTIDGYSQAGAQPNTSPILGANDAVLKIVIDSRKANYPTTDGNHPLQLGANSMNYSLFPDCKGLPFASNQFGYGTGDAAQIGIFRATNVVIRGLCFLLDWFPNDPSGVVVDSIALATDPPTNSYAGNGFPQLNLRVSGCWFNLMPDGATVVEGGDNAVCTRWHRYSGSNPTSRWSPGGTQVGVQKGSASPRGDFNIFMSYGTPVSLHGWTNRIQGNFFNVFPDGMHQYFPDPLTGDPVTYVPTATFIGGVRDGRQLVGVDGDGVNDAEERNIFAGLPRLRATAASAIDQQLGAYDIRVSGNYFGMAIDGVTRFTNCCTFLRLSDRPNPATNVVVGSDFNGVSDALEGNVICTIHPLDYWFPDPTAFDPATAIVPDTFTWNNPYTGLSSLPETINPDAQTGPISVSFRGNKCINNFSPPISPYCTSPNRSQQCWYFVYYTNTITPYLPITQNFGMGGASEASTNAIPIVDPASSTRRLKGTFQLGRALVAVNPATNILIDVYRPNEDGLTNGLKFTLTANALPAGWVQGESCIVSNLVADKPGLGDLNPATGEFSFDISHLHLPSSTKVTVTASYSTNKLTYPQGLQTSRFSLPVTLVGAPDITITSITQTGGNATLSWTGGDAPYVVEKSTDLGSGIWAPVATTATPSAEVAVDASQAYFRIR